VETCSELKTCSPENCRRACAQEVIDALLRAHGAVRGEEVDLLLELRWLVRHREQAETTLRLFCDLRRRLEETHYLLFYRLRRWLENNLEVVVVCGSAEPVKIPLKLDFYCLEAILARRVGELRRQGLLVTNSKAVLAFTAQEPSRVAAG
jgi:hypothetical protein